MNFYVPESQVEAIPVGNGYEAKYLWQMFPWYKSTITELEMSYSGVYSRSNYVMAYPNLPLYFIAGYLIVIFGGRHLMKDRKAFDLKEPLAYWNLFLALFSFCGMVRVVPYLIYFTFTMPFKDINCTPFYVTHGDKEVGFWCALFAGSKFIELIDTLFIVLRKKPLIFLHWYHHVTVLAFTWYACYYEHSGLYFVAMNYTVHAFMYFYYFLMAKKAVPKWFKPQWITLLQISQMVVGVGTGLATAYYKFYTDSCPGASKDLLFAGFVMYSSYLYLFVEFAVKRFILRKPAEKSVSSGSGVSKSKSQ